MSLYVLHREWLTLRNLVLNPNVAARASQWMYDPSGQGLGLQALRLGLWAQA